MIPDWLTEEHLRREGEIRKTYLPATYVDGQTEQQILELRKLRTEQGRA